uniref:non-specific serine/threonine protein kinase n=1 Tax=Fagus sylvatica TaxID=28930 RepID=A0A2N9ENN5_FAGSY
MHPITFISALLFSFAASATTSFADDEYTIPSNCNWPFDCGPFKNLSHPFTTGAQPTTCGPPEFQLSKYLWDDTCLTKEFTNTTLNSSTILNYSTDNEDLTIYYGCYANFSNNSQTPSNQFNCSSNNANKRAGFYLTGRVPTDPVLSITTCSVGVTVKILKTAAFELTSNRSTLKDALRKDSSNKKKAVSSVQLGLFISGGAVAGILLGGWVFFIIQRKKSRAIESQSKELIPTPPSSKGLPASSTSFSRSTPSYPYSKLDVEKGSTYFGAQIFSYEELEEATNNFDSSRELGDGGFGTVYYGKLHDGRVVAVKRLYENNFKRVEQFMTEVEILTKIRHKNLVTLYGCTSKRSRELLLVYEYIPNGTVADHLHGNRSKSGLLTLQVRLSIAIESAEALAYLHLSDVIHRDVKTNNILLDENFRVKVADFGLSRLFPTDVTHVSTAPQGTPGYVDPEYYQCYQLTDKSDVYSFGVVLIELISSLPAVDTNRHRHDINLANMAVNKIQNHALHELVDLLLGFEKDNTVKRMTTSVAELAFRCLQQERDMRPSMNEVLKALKGIQNEEIGAQKAEVVDIRAADDVGLLKNIPPPLSPDSVVTDKWVSSSTPSSF